ncbi:MAG: EAL domain-containing response regulator [Burkholderiales bacterium]
MNIADLSFLVVEDEEFQRQTIVALLKRFGARQIKAMADGQQALGIFLKYRMPPDVIICDLKMPIMDGLEFIRRIGTTGFRGSVVILSALDHALIAAAEAMTKAYGINLLGAITKPVTLESLEALLRRHGAAPPKLRPRSTSRPSFTLDEVIEGLEQNQFEPFYQPKVELATRRIVGAEALARWRHPQEGIVLPGAFIKVLEEAGKIDELTWIMLRKAITFCSRLNATGTDSSIAVNLSLKSLNNAELANRIIEIAERLNLAPAKICLEITESAATTNLGAALENLTRLRMSGFGLSIDDFGTGYSSMQQLVRIPFSELKIDRSFVANAGTHEAATVILTSSLQIARQLKIRAVAEGVETQQQWDYLQELGCDHAQGYFIAKPMEANSYVKWLRDINNDATSMFVAA